MLTRLKIREVSSVDRGAGDGVKILLMKREDDEPYWKREFSAEQRRHDAKSGAAESDGSYPIHNSRDLHNAMQAVGRSKNPSKTRAHIRARARALGLTSQLSDSFKRDDMPKFKKFFDTLFGGSNNSVVIDKSLDGLAESISSILADDQIDKGGALSETLEQFGDHLKQTLTAGPAVIEKDNEMNIQVLAKALGLADTATEADVTAAIAKSMQSQTETARQLAKMNVDLQNAQAGYTADEEAYLKKESMYDEEEDEKPELSDGEKDKKRRKKAFRLASHEERNKIMKKAEPDQPEWVRKMQDDMAELRKQNQELMQSAGLASFAKKASTLGLPETEAVTLQKAYAGDKASIDKLLTFTQSAVNAARTGAVFKEFVSGHGDGGNATPYEQLLAKADELRKHNPNMTQAQAFAKVYEDPANIEIVKRERAENRPSAA